MSIADPTSTRVEGLAFSRSIQGADMGVRIRVVDEPIRMNVSVLVLSAQHLGAVRSSSIRSAYEKKSIELLPVKQHP